ncbi:MAG: hypothetical protein LQ351_000005 [Letrouitia transgressa]|nr:MAG: hypothetical protein LQ351_000005 [Letrouitia transgressa]
MLGRDQSYSTLEAASSLPPIQTIRANQPFPIDLGKQVAPDNGKQVTPDNGKQFAADRTGLEVTINNDSWTNHVEIIDDRVVQRHRSLRKWKAIAGAIIVMIVLAVVFGVIFGSRHTNSSTRAPVQLSDSSTTAPSATSNQATALPTLLPRRNIAAVSFESNSVNNTHIYFLDNHGRVIQAAQTTKNTTWVLRIIGTGAKKGSALAAAVSRRYFTLVNDLSNMASGADE